MPSDAPSGHRFDSSTVVERALIARLYREFGERLKASLEWRISSRMQSRLDAADILQETMLRAMQKWGHAALTELPPYALV